MSAGLLKKPQIILAGVGALAMFLLGWVFGSRYFDQEMQAARATSEQLVEARLELEAQRQELIRLGTGAEVDAEALEKLRQTVAHLDESSMAQKQQLMLYSKLLDLEAGADGLQILIAEVAPGLEAPSYLYSFVVRQQAATLKPIKVVYTLRVDGMQEAEEISYGLATLDPAIESDKVETRLKYFRVIEGEIKLPERFLPKTLTISAWPAKTPKRRRDLTLDWPTETGEQ